MGKMPATLPSDQARTIASHMYGVAVRRVLPGEEGVIQPAGPRSERTDLISGEPAEQNRRKQDEEVVRDRSLNNRDHRLRIQPGADPQVSMEEGFPEIQVLLPERDVQTEGFDVVTAEDFHGLRTAPDAGNHNGDRVARHKAGNQPVYGHSNEEGEQVDEDFSSQVSSHGDSLFSMLPQAVSGLLLVLTTSAGEGRGRHGPVCSLPQNSTDGNRVGVRRAAKPPAAHPSTGKKSPLLLQREGRRQATTGLASVR